MGAGQGARRGVTPSADGVPISYTVGGDGPVALVFVHGWCGEQRHWARQVGPFSADFTVVTLDLAGHGASGGGRGDWTIEAFAADVSAVVRHLGLRRIVLLGHSQGGSVVVEAAALLAAETLAVIGIDTWSSLQGQPLSADAAEQMLEPFRRDFRAHTASWIRRMFAPMSDPALADTIAAVMADCEPAMAIAAMAGHQRYTPNLPRRMRELRAPLFAIASEFSLYPKDPEVARRHGIEFTKMAGVGHFLMLEAPERFNAELEAVLQRIVRG